MITSDTIQKGIDTQSQPRRDRSKYIIEKHENETIYKHNNDISGSDFKIRRNTNCTIYILDYTSGMFIDDCINCKIITGPCSGSIFMRTSKNCSLSTITRQLRFRDCENIKVFTFCPTDPEVESSFNIFFAAYNSFYPHLKEHFIKAGFDKNEDNHIGTPYDFTPDKILGNGEKHFDKMKKEDFIIEKIEDNNEEVEEMFDGYTLKENWVKDANPSYFGKGNNDKKDKNDKNDKNDVSDIIFEEKDKSKDIEDRKEDSVLNNRSIKLEESVEEEIKIKKNKRRRCCCCVF